MQIFKYLIVFLLFSLISCEKPPVYPNIPEIKFRSIERHLITHAANILADSILIHVNFKDGDGDLGLSEEEGSFLYRPFDPVKNKDGSFILIGTHDSLPPFNNCSYIVDELVKDHAGLDTVYVKFNINTNNYFCQLLIKNEKGDFVDFNKDVSCQSIFNGRFPVLRPDGYVGPLDGILTFTISEPSLRFFVKNGQKGKFRVYIKDRSLNTSNTIETSEFVFQY